MAIIVIIHVALALLGLLVTISAIMPESKATGQLLLVAGLLILVFDVVSFFNIMAALKR